MSRYIDAERFRKEISVDKYGHIETTITKLNIAIEHSTVDAVEVVRCKDCKWCRLYQLFGTDNYQCERNALSAYFWVEPTDYCSYGERREVQRNFNASNTLDALETEVTE